MAEKEHEQRDRKFWAVSPNVQTNNRTVAAWKQATLTFHAAFMGYRPDDRGHMAMGYKFAHDILPGDVVLIARRHRKRPDIVAFGIVKGEFRKRLRGFKSPEKEWHGSLRRLYPFRTAPALPREISVRAMMKVLGHTAAFCRLHPRRNRLHKLVCAWMEQNLSTSTNARYRPDNGVAPDGARLVAHSHKGELEYQVRTMATIKNAIKKEEKLVREYVEWLEQRGHKSERLRDGNLCCDVYEQDRNNLIEAKASLKREYIRMAVGQLFDYAYMGRKRFGKPHMAILLPRKPDLKSLNWLPDQISIVWKVGRGFADNAEKAFV